MGGGHFRAAGRADVQVILAERQRLSNAAQLRHLERRCDAQKEAGGAEDPQLAQSIEQAVLQHAGAEVCAHTCHLKATCPPCELCRSSIF